jgi:hypothetical protein
MYAAMNPVMEPVTRNAVRGCANPMKGGLAGRRSLGGHNVDVMMAKYSGTRGGHRRCIRAVVQFTLMLSVILTCIRCVFEFKTVFLVFCGETWRPGNPIQHVGDGFFFTTEGNEYSEYAQHGQ